MPEAAVDEDDGAVPRQHDVGRSGEVADMESEAIPGAVEHGANRQFRAGILAPDLGHDR